MKPLPLLLCLLALCVVAPVAGAATNIPFWHRHKKDHATIATTQKPKTKRSFLHHARPTREEDARAEATYGMSGPRSVGFWHPQPGPAGVGAK